MITSSQTVRTHTQHSFSWHVCPFTLNFGFVTEGGGLQVTENCAKRSPQLLSVRSLDAVQPRHDAEMRSSVQSLRFQKMTGKFSGAPPPSAAPSSPSSSLGEAHARVRSQSNGWRRRISRSRLSLFRPDHVELPPSEFLIDSPNHTQL